MFKWGAVCAGFSSILWLCHPSLPMADTGHRALRGSGLPGCLILSAPLNLAGQDPGILLQSNLSSGSLLSWPWVYTKHHLVWALFLKTGWMHSEAGGNHSGGCSAGLFPSAFLLCLFRVACHSTQLSEDSFQFSPSTVWILGQNSGRQALVTSTFTC